MRKKRYKFSVLVIIVTLILGGAAFYYIKYSKGSLPSFITENINTYSASKKYVITKADRIISEADTEKEAISEVKKNKRSIAINTYTDKWVYSDLLPFFIITNNAVHDFETFSEAYKYASTNDYKQIYYKDNKTIIWEAKNELKDTLLSVPLIPQLPELPRGCEVTSLAMLLRYRGIEVSKIKLAQEVKRDPTPYSKDSNGRIQYGNPYDGFVGDMYDMKKNGYAVYHGPIVELAQEYCGEKAIDLTGIQFEDILYFVEQGNPVWIITNSTYNSLSDEYFEMWHTPTGIVKVTKKLHSVVITGFNKDKIYINDPLSNNKNRAVNRKSFQLAWEQMGNQAMTIITY